MSNLSAMEHAFHDAADRKREEQQRVVPPKYPNIVFDTDGVAYERTTLVMDVYDEMASNGVAAEELEMYRKQALGGDYETAVVVTGRWVTLR